MNRNGLSTTESIGALTGGFFGACYGLILNQVLFGLKLNQSLSDPRLLDISLANGAIGPSIYGLLMGVVFGITFAIRGSSRISPMIRKSIPKITILMYGAIGGGTLGGFLYVGLLWLYSYITKNPSPTALHHVIITTVVGVVIGLAFFSEEVWSNIMSGESNNNRR